jgi:hypothetical protein
VQRMIHSARHDGLGCRKRSGSNGNGRFMYAREIRGIAVLVETVLRSHAYRGRSRLRGA